MADAPKPKKRDSVAKRARQNLVRRARNVAIKSALKTINKKFLTIAAGTDKAAAEASYLETISAFDRAVSKGVIHKNKASRKKSRLARRLAKVGTKPATKKGSKKA